MSKHDLIKKVRKSREISGRRGIISQFCTGTINHFTNCVIYLTPRSGIALSSASVISFSGLFSPPLFINIVVLVSDLIISASVPGS